MRRISFPPPPPPPQEAPLEERALQRYYNMLQTTLYHADVVHRRAETWLVVSGGVVPVSRIWGHKCSFTNLFINKFLL